MGTSSLQRRKVASLLAAESTLHCIEILGCVFKTMSALSHGQPGLAVWSLSALASSLLALYLQRCHRRLYTSSWLRPFLHAAMRIHRAIAVNNNMRRVLQRPGGMAASLGLSGGSAAPGDPMFFAKAVLVNSSILPILLQALVLQLPLALQVAVQVAVAAVVLRAMPEYCAAVVADGANPSHFEWLAWVQRQLATVVMAATTSSRGLAKPADVPCVVSLSHLVIVFEVILPCLFVWYFDLAAQAWFGDSPDADGAERPSNGQLCLAAQALAVSDSGRGSSAAASLQGSRAAANAQHGAAAAAAAGSGESGAAVAAQLQLQPSGTAGTAQVPPNGTTRASQPPQAGRQSASSTTQCPSAALVLLFAAGLSGILFDVMLTMHDRWPQAL